MKKQIRSVLPQRSLVQSANSGRLIVAQQFTAGNRHEVSKSVKRTADQKGPSNATGLVLSAVRFTDFTSILTLSPSMNRWATVSRPQLADWAEKTLSVRLIRSMMFCFLVTVSGALIAQAQVASGGSFRIDQSVVANGGGTSASSGNTYKVEGTAGQPLAGTILRGGQFAHSGGFWADLTINQPPDALNDELASMPEDSGARIIAIASLLSNDANESGQTLSFSLVAGSEVGGTISSDATNVYFTPAANFNGPASFQYTVTDDGTTSELPDSKTDTATVSFMVSEINDAPTSVNDTLANIVESAGPQTIPFATLTANDTKGPVNEIGQSLIVKTVSNPVGGTVTITEGNVLFTPAIFYNGRASFQYTVEDNGMTSGTAGPLSSATATVSFNITEVNDAPDALNDTLSSVVEDSGVRTIAITSLLSNDGRGVGGTASESEQTLSFALLSASGIGGTVSSDATNVYFTPAVNFNGPASFQYTVADNGTTNGVPDPKSDTATVSFTITEINNAPTALGDTLTNAAEDSGPRTIPFATLTANDAAGPANESGQSLVVHTVSNAVGGTVSILGGNVVFTPTADYFGPVSFQYTVTDNGTTDGVPDPKSDTVTVTFAITEVNDAPTAVNDTLVDVLEDSAAATIPFATLTGNDATGPANESVQTLVVKTVTNPVGGTVSLVGGNVVFTPATNYHGPASFDYTVDDNGSSNGAADPRSSGTATARFNIMELNDAPTASDDLLPSMAEDSGQRTIPFVALTGNDAKGAANESGQTLVVKTVGNAVGGTVILAGGDVLFTPTADYSGPASFDYTVEDNGTTNGAVDPKTSAAATASFAITAVNDAPATVNDTLTSIAEDSAPRAIPFADLIVNDTRGAANESGQTLAVISANNAVGGTVELVAGFVVFTPAENFNGPASFNYTVQDNGTTNGVADPKTSGSGAVQFNITEVNDVPTAVNDTLGNLAENSGERSIAFTELTANDIKGPADEGGQSLIVTAVSNPVGVTVSIVEGTVRVAPLPDYHGAASFQYTVRDNGTTNGFGDEKISAAATASFNINALDAVDNVIRFSSGSYSVAENAGFKTITVERSGDTSQAVTVDYSSSDHSNPADFIPCTSPGAGLASSRCDFTTAMGTLRFAAGETSKSFNVLISQDNYAEGTETLELTLSNATGGAVFGVPQMAILSITDDTTEAATNPIDTSIEFVRSQYHDFLNREPDPPGLAFWTDNIDKCNDPARRPADLTAAQCIDKQRESTAVAFFMSPEFQITGGFVYHLYKGSLTGALNYDGGSPGSSLGRFPTSLEFMRDLSTVSEGIVVNNQISGAVVEANRNRLATEFVQRPEFVAKYGGLNDTLYVEELFNTTGISTTDGEKQMLVDGLTKGTETRASVLRKVVDGTVVISEGNVQVTTSYGQAFNEQELKRVFVYMEYVGYLRRNPDAAGFVFWLGKLNQYHGDPFQAEMVRSFILSPEYRLRFGQ
jgi:hypothetical protein